MLRAIKICLLSLIFIMSCSLYEKDPYRKERLIKLDNDDGYITRYYFSLGRTDSVRIYHEDVNGNYNYNKPIAAYSLRNTAEDLFIAEIKNDTVIVYFKNDILRITQEIYQINSHRIKFDLIDTFKWLEKKKMLKEEF